MQLRKVYIYIYIPNPSERARCNTMSLLSGVEKV